MAAGPNRGKLFLAFADETSARETYGAGRYIDVNKTPGQVPLPLTSTRLIIPIAPTR